MKEYQIAEQSIRDVYEKPDTVNENKYMRQYKGYQIGLICESDPLGKRVIVITCWKRRTAF